MSKELIEKLKNNSFVRAFGQAIGFVIFLGLWVLFFWALLSLMGCQQTVLHPTEGHVYFVPEKIELETTNYGTIITRHEGIWMSKWYFNELVDAKIE